MPMKSGVKLTAKTALLPMNIASHSIRVNLLQSWVNRLAFHGKYPKDAFVYAV